MSRGIGGLAVVWRTAVSPITFVALALLRCLDPAVGSFLIYSNPAVFGSMDAYPFARWPDQVGRGAIPLSLWVYMLTLLSRAMVLSLLFCTLNWFIRRRRRLPRAGGALVRLGFP